MMSTLFRRFCIGVGFAAATYLIIITTRVQSTMPTPRKTWSVLIIGGLIGVASLLFELALSDLSALVGHFLLTLGLVMIMLWINHWFFDMVTFLMILVIYVIIWVIIRLTQVNDVKRINEKLHDRNQH